MKKWKYSKNADQVVVQDKKPSFFRNKRAMVLSMGIGIIVLMVGSVLTLSLFNQNDTNQIEYNGFFFYLGNQGWVTTIGGQRISFEQTPEDVEDIPLEPFALNSNKIYVAFDPEDRNEDSYEIQRIRSFLIFTGKSASAACSTEDECSDIPVVDCEDSGSVVYFKDGEKSRIYREGNCVILEASKGRETEVVNRFVFTYLGIMQ